MQSDSRQLLKETTLSLRKIAIATGLSKSTVGILKELIRTNNAEAIKKSTTDISASTRERCAVLSTEEESMIVERLLFAAARGFTVDVEGIRAMMTTVAADDRKGWEMVYHLTMLNVLSGLAIAK